MAINIRDGRIVFPSGTGVQTVRMVFIVNRFPRACWVALAGYQAKYDSSDHHIKTLQVELSADMLTTDDGPTIYVTARLHLRDKNADDRFSGWIDFVLFADTGRPVFDASILTAGVERWSL
jgi:hypothetical protein